MSEQKKQSLLEWILKRIRRHFLSGMLVAVPMVVVIMVMVWFFVTVDNVLQPLINAIFGREIIGLGFAISLVLIYLIGVAAGNFVGRYFINTGEKILSKVPILRQLYNGTKQVLSGISGSGIDKAAFREVVLVEFPRDGMQTIGFITNEVTNTEGEKMLMVYIPTAPIPTSGYFEIVPEHKVTPIDISIDEAMQMVVSSGIVSPKVINTTGKLNKAKPTTEK